MEIVKTLNIPASFFYDKVMDSVLLMYVKRLENRLLVNNLKTLNTSNNSHKIAALASRSRKLLKISRINFEHLPQK